MLEFWVKLWQWLPEILPVLWHATAMTVRVTIGALAVALVLGLVVALMRISPLRPLRYLALAYTDLLRGTPALVQLFIIYFGLADLGLEFDPVTAAIIGLGINGAAYVGEIYRAGIEAVPSGQMEAARSLGMSHRQAMRKVIVPQAVRKVIPPLLNDFIALMKDTTLVSFIGLIETVQAGSDIAAETLNSSALTLGAFLFVLVTIPLARLVDFMIGRQQARYQRGLA